MLLSCVAQRRNPELSIIPHLDPSGCAIEILICLSSPSPMSMPDGRAVHEPGRIENI